MASDLSKLIEETLCSTINGLLAKDAVLKNTNKAVDKDLLDIETLRVDSTYEFDNINSTWSFIIPAYTSSYIFNCMLGDDSEPSLSIDDDIADAINEFISNVSGSLTTVINGAAFEDLGSSKFTIVEKEIIPANTITDFENMYKFTIDIDNKEATIFILFDKVITPFLDAISKSEASIHEEPIVEEPIVEEAEEQQDSEESTKEEITNAPTDTKPDEKSDEKPDEKPKENDNIEIENVKDDEEQEELDPEELKAKKLKKIIIIVAGVLVTTILAGVVMFFLGMFDPEPIVIEEDTNATKTVKTKDDVTIVQYNKKSEINFKTSMINVDRLNARLEELSKYEILSSDELEKQKLLEKDRLYALKKETELLEFAAKNKEEDIFAVKQNNNLSNDTEVIDTNHLKFVLVQSLQYKLYKNLISKTNSKNGRISICKNENGRTVVYLGPFENSKSQNKMFELLKNEGSTDISLETLTKAQFDTRCNFE
ncbi:MAG: hypothetical protein U9Q20_04615 [Campylobacterota bacterium]|nr:hypothetical protein [Campylobacterota bacterium]